MVLLLTLNSQCKPTLVGGDPVALTSFGEGMSAIMEVQS